MRLLSNFTYPTNPQNLFGAKRKFDYHTGIDLFAPEGTPVLAFSPGIIIDIGYFTGPNTNPPTPWWNETFFVMVQTETDIVHNYGEVYPLVKIGDVVNVGDTIWTVMKVLKNDKGLPMSMLHFEMYSKYPGNWVVWEHDSEQPDILMDPTEYVNFHMLNI